jgi:hypothetical protein
LIRYLHIVLLLLITGIYAQAQGIIIPAGAYVVQSNGNLGVGGNLKNDGSFTHNGGTVVFNGSTQAINGSTAIAFNNIRINTGSSTTINTSGQTLKGGLLCNGSLNANNNLILLSTATQTALIDGAGTGNVTGNLTMQRYIPSAFGYKYLSSPFQAATVNELSDELNLSASFPPLYYYEEDLNSTGWNYYINPAQPLAPLKGYAANFGTTGGPVTVDITGVVNNGNINTGTIYNHNRTYTQGFHLLGNPYPSPIDWNAASGWTRTNIDNAIYYFDADNSDQYTGTYSSYINGVSSNGIANNIIPAMQGFFIHVTNGSYPVSGSLAMTNNVRINNYNPSFHRMAAPTVPLLRLNAAFATQLMKADPVVIYFEDNATEKFNEGYDALKLINTNKKVPSIYALSNDLQRLSIDAIATPADNITVIPLGIETETVDMLRIEAADISHMPGNMHLYLTDAVNKTVQNLREQPIYTTTITEGKSNGRFSVIFSYKELSSTDIALTPELNAYVLDGKLYVHLSAMTGTNGTLRMTNIAGQITGTYQLDGYGDHEIPMPMANGVYILTYRNNSSSNVLTKKIFIGIN